MLVSWYNKRKKFYFSFSNKIFYLWRSTIPYITFLCYFCPKNILGYSKGRCGVMSRVSTISAGWSVWSLVVSQAWLQHWALWEGTCLTHLEWTQSFQPTNGAEAIREWDTNDHCTCLSPGRALSGNTHIFLVLRLGWQSLWQGHLWVPCSLEGSLAFEYLDLGLTGNRIYFSIS